MSGQRVAMGSRDYIGRLPDEVLGKILSLLLTNRAACTSVLSKRWRNLLALVDNLELREEACGPHGFCDFVEKTLSLLRNSPSPPIKRFSLTLSRAHEASRVNSWICTALDLGCLALYLESVNLDCTETKLMSNTLVELTIRNWHSPQVRLPPGSMIFPALKTLSLRSLEFADFEMYHDLISSFPLLEDLFLYYSEDDITPTWSGNVLNPSIKRLTIFNHYPRYPEAHIGCCFKTPSLEYFDYTSYVEDHYEVDFPSLVEARLDLLSWDAEDDDFCGDVTDLVAGISNVKSLHLSAHSLEALHCCCESLPVFHNLLSLSFESSKEKGWQVLPLLLNNSPNLDTLIIKGLVHQVTNSCGNACACIPKKKKKKKVEEEVCCLTTCQVKVLNISGYRGTCRERKQMRHFLANFKSLKTVQVGVKVSHGEDNSQYLRITDALLKLPRVSSDCQIHFV